MRLQIACQLLRLLDIPSLRALVPTRQKNDDALPLSLVVDSLARSEIHTQFENTFTYRTAVTRIARRQSLDPHHYTRPPLHILKRVYPP